MTTIPTDAETATARTLLQALVPLQGAHDVPVTIADRHLRIPAVMMPVLVAAARLISEGHAIDVIAARFDIDGGAIPHFKLYDRKGNLHRKFVEIGRAHV